MAIHDRWHKPERVRDPATGTMVKTGRSVPSAEYGRGLRWQVRWFVDGEEQRKSFARRKGKNPNLHAEAFEAQVQAQVDADTYVDQATAEMTFMEYAEKQWRPHRTHGQTTAGKVDTRLRLHTYAVGKTGRTARGGPALGHHKLRDLAKRPSLTQAWIAGIKLAPGSAAGVVSTVSSVFNAAVDDGIITKNPLKAKSVTTPQPPKNDAVPFTMRQIDDLGWALRHHARCRPDCARCRPNRFDVLPELGMNTGMRQGELFGVAVEDVNFLKRMITVGWQVKLINGKQAFSEIKNDKVHQVPVLASTCTLLARYMERWPPVLVTLPEERDGKFTGGTVTRRLIFTRPSGEAMHREGVNGRWRSALKRAGIEADREKQRRWMMHCLRHTAVSIWLSAGLGPSAVAEFIGDTEATVIAHYSHMMPKDNSKARQAMEDFMAGAGDAEIEGRESANPASRAQ